MPFPAAVFACMVHAVEHPVALEIVVLILAIRPMIALCPAPVEVTVIPQVVVPPQALFVFAWVKVIDAQAGQEQSSNKNGISLFISSPAPLGLLGL